MKRLFFQLTIYDYKTKKEAESHMVQMEERCWHVKETDGERITFLGEDCDYKYTVEYYKEA